MSVDCFIKTKLIMQEILPHILSYFYVFFLVDVCIYLLKPTRMEEIFIQNFVHQAFNSVQKSWLCSSSPLVP